VRSIRLAEVSVAQAAGLTTRNCVSKSVGWGAQATLIERSQNVPLNAAIRSCR